MPENAARKQLVRAIARRFGLRYTAALRLLERREARERTTLAPGEASARFGRPAAILAEPPRRDDGPRFGTSTGVDERLRGIRLVYGRHPPSAYVLTFRPLAGERLPADLLAGELHDFAARYRGVPAEQTWPAAQAAPRTPATVRFRGELRPCTAIRLAGCVGLQLAHDNGLIVYCGPDTSAEVHLALDEPRR